MNQQPGEREQKAPELQRKEEPGEARRPDEVYPQHRQRGQFGTHGGLAPPGAGPRVPAKPGEQG